MGFSIETYRRELLHGMTALYNAETACEGHIAPLDPQRFVNLVEDKSYFDPSGLLVAIESEEVVGWVHACLAAGSEPHHEPHQPVPQIRMLIYPANRLKVGAALVAEATSWLRKTATSLVAQAPSLLALHAQQGYPFYRGLWLGSEPMCPASLPHLQLALEVAGYRNTQESVFMVASMPSPPDDSVGRGPLGMPAIELTDSPVEMTHQPMRESWVGFEPMITTALSGGEQVGSIGWVMLPQVAERLGAPAVNIWRLGVAEQHRRRGVATALIAHAMARGHRLGARSASVGTQLWNAPAHASYAKLGFLPHCVLVGRTLSLEEA